MSDTDQEKREDEVLRRMLATKPKPHKSQSGSAVMPKGIRGGTNREKINK